MKKKLLVILASIAIAAPLLASPVAYQNFSVTLPVVAANGLFYTGDFNDEGYKFSDNGNITFNTFSAAFGYFAADNVELTLIFDYISERGGSNTYKYGIGTAYYFDMGEILPFAGLNFVMADREFKLWSIGFQAGAACMMSNNVAAYGAFNAEYIDNDTLEMTGMEFGLEAGLKFFF